VSEIGVEIVCVAAPASDQDVIVYVVPLFVCGETTPRVRWIPSTPTTLAGVASGWPSRVSWRPDGLVAKDIVVLRGTTSVYVVEVSPVESVTVRWMRYQTLAEVSPVVGTTKEPDLAPVQGAMNGWVCVS
jgi:hypothetical protein